MHIEIQVALNFIISYLYNKLPRRRVNLFGDELEKALKKKFEGHWYPELPFKVRKQYILNSTVYNIFLLSNFKGFSFSLFENWRTSGSIYYFTKWKYQLLYSMEV